MCHFLILLFLATAITQTFQPHNMASVVNMDILVPNSIAMNKLLPWSLDQVHANMFCLHSPGRQMHQLLMPMACSHDKNNTLYLMMNVFRALIAYGY